MNNTNTNSRTIEVPVNSTEDRQWVRTNHKGERVAVVLNPNYEPPTLTVDDIYLPGL